ncbi:MAG TPA: TIGR01777 family oxidoreductase [Candidatus Hydrogenedentes bacterium]|nr:TIGR01777 family oxidoreductase [Candidatus Hydrogenedentota bacterium]HOV75625.1 TIGR01777 family oxidoreductase [Candidatus Hydrogenedentota bacterium]HPC17510.1 TIGR01777 family oxidoreductase [Candidatus Hydrogenedentota bacterium]HRT21406.1 TIGR01777 family oxidoreductase [Candidatus Hydrogenedentota bacterium]HRT66294.1 TIGR01777 family oxidoreductase [Candidatus Hydrogenedentota bacterium]
MKIIVSGASGLIGTALVADQMAAGHEVVRLVRAHRPETSGVACWNPEAGELDPCILDKADAMVHLSGENIAQGRWSAARKARIRDSRVKSTECVVQALLHAANPPKTFLCASAIGFYGSRGDERLTETSGPGTGFLAEVCQAWETATHPASDRGIRVVNLRFGMVLSGAGGALRAMLPAFRLGMGGIVGNGRQYMSWIAIDDLVAAIRLLLHNESLSGPVNIVSPHPVANSAFTKTLGRILHRPAIIPVPAFAIRLALGEMADALLLSSQRVEPARLLGAGFAFQYPDLEAALKQCLA